jgi:hypothetical protein
MQVPFQLPGYQPSKRETTYSVQVGQEGDDHEWNRVDETDKDQGNLGGQGFCRLLCGVQVVVAPDLKVSIGNKPAVDECKTCDIFSSRCLLSAMDITHSTHLCNVKVQILGLSVFDHRQARSYSPQRDER